MQCEHLESRRLMSVTLNPSTHVLTVIGTAGNDTISAKAAGGSLAVSDNGVVRSFPVADVAKLDVFAAAGADQVWLDASVTLPALLDSGAGSPVYMEYDSIVGGSGKDVIYLRSDFGYAEGGAGDDAVWTWGGFAAVHGQGGNDVIVAKAGVPASNFYTGGPGNDTLDYSAGTTGMIVKNGYSSWYTKYDGTTPVPDAMYPDSVREFENLAGTQGDDYIYGTAGGNVLRGNGGNDVLRGGDGNDHLSGGGGTDALFGEGGNDTLYGRDGTKDFFSGGAGDDQAQGDAVDVVNSTRRVS